MSLLIAIDGPVGAGKSTISDEVAKAFHILHLDTGAMYRAVAYHMLKNNVCLSDEKAVQAYLAHTKLSVIYKDNTQYTYVNEQNVTPFIRDQAVGQGASLISKYPFVRQKLVAQQREIATKTDMLLDGRDIGTVVLTNATAKIFLTASIEARAKRRFDQLVQKGETPCLTDIMEEVKKRDFQDENRAADPLKQAEDAVLVDSSNLTFDQTVQAIVRIVQQKREEKAHAE